LVPGDHRSTGVAARDNGRQAVVGQVREDGRVGLLRFLDTSWGEWFIWQELQQAGEWRMLTGRQLAPRDPVTASEAGTAKIRDPAGDRRAGLTPRPITIGTGLGRSGGVTAPPDGPPACSKGIKNHAITGGWSAAGRGGCAPARLGRSVSVRFPVPSPRFQDPRRPRRPAYPLG
jgi:hypothetical protein